MRRSIHPLFLYFLFMLPFVIIVGCQESGQQSQLEPVITLKLWAGTPEHVGPKEVVDNWNHLNSNIQVEYQFFENTKDGNAKLEMAIFSGREVDIVIGYHPEMLMDRIDADLFEPLDDYLRNDQFDLIANFGEGSVERFREKHYYIPANRSFEGILINRSALDEMGIPLPKENWTWDEFADLARKLTIHDEGLSRFGISDGILATIVRSYFGNNPFVDGQGEMVFSRPIWEKILMMTYHMYNRDFSIYTHDDFTQKFTLEQLFLTEKIAMLPNLFRVRAVKDTEQYNHNFKTAILPYPRLFSEKQPNSSYGVQDFVSISSTSQHKEEAWKFIKWYVTEGFAPMMKYGRTPTWLNVSTDEYMDVFFEGTENLFDLESFRQFYNGDYLFDFPKVNTASDDFMSIVNGEGDKYFQGIQSLQETLDNMELRAHELYNVLNMP